MKHLFLFLFVIVNISIYGQKDETIYEFGKLVTSCESNFENLFQNWGPSFVTNYNEIELLSYEYVEMLLDTSRINYYADLFTDLDAFFPIISKKNHDIVELRIITIKQYIDSIPDSDLKEQYKKKELKNMLDFLKHNLKNTIQVGDKVYLIKLKIKGVYAENHVFCSSKTNEIIFDRLFLGLIKLKKN
jgi:hypothetical protein